MRPNSTQKLLHSKGYHLKNEMKIHRMGENLCKWCNQYGLNLQNTQITHITEQQKNQTTQLKNGQKTKTDISPKKTYGWPTGTWQNVQHH